MRAGAAGESERAEAAHAHLAEAVEPAGARHERERKLAHVTGGERERLDRAIAREPGRRRLADAEARGAPRAVLDGEGHAVADADGELRRQACGSTTAPTVAAAERAS